MLELFGISVLFFRNLSRFGYCPEGLRGLPFLFPILIVPAVSEDERHQERETFEGVGEEGVLFGLFPFREIVGVSSTDDAFNLLGENVPHPVEVGPAFFRVFFKQESEFSLLVPSVYRWRSEVQYRDFERKEFPVPDANELPEERRPTVVVQIPIGNKGNVPFEGYPVDEEGIWRKEFHRVVS